MTSTNNKQLLDPISTLCRLIYLNFTPIGTRIGNINNSIVIQLPSSLQWMKRKINGDDRDDISNIHPTILSIINWYIIPLYNLKHHNKRVKIIKRNEFEKDEYLEIDENDVEKCWLYISRLCEYMCKGLNRLQDTYKNGNVVLSLQYYKNIIKDSLENKFDDNRIPNNVSNNVLKYDKIKDIWSYKEIKEVCELYDKCFEIEENCNENDNICGYLLAIDNILNKMENLFRDRIK